MPTVVTFVQLESFRIDAMESIFNTNCNNNNIRKLAKD